MSALNLTMMSPLAVYLDEMSDSLKAVWTQFDANKDGAIDLNEFKAYMRNRFSQNQPGVHKVSPGLAIPQIGHLFSLNENNGHAVDKSDIGTQEYVWAGENAVAGKPVGRHAAESRLWPSAEGE